MNAINLEKCKDLYNGINIHTLKPGTTVFAITKNSLYKIIKGTEDEYDVIIQGGKHFPDPIKGNFSGSTFGGSMMKLGWIGHMMHMEIYIPDLGELYITTGVRAARIIGAGWEYDMEWGNEGTLQEANEGDRYNN